jgi:uncharacterized protein
MRRDNSDGQLIPIIIIILINLLVYLAVNIAGFSEINLLPFLGLSRRTFFSEPWTIITFMFTHQEFWHILANMVTLFFFGSFFNRIAGVKYLFITYLVGGLCSGIFVLLLSPDYAITIGASGAVFALMGAVTLIEPNLKVFIFPIPIPIPLWVGTLIGFLILLPIGGVSWQGHLGGLLFGLLIGWYLRDKVRVIF